MRSRGGAGQCLQMRAATAIQKHTLTFSFSMIVVFPALSRPTTTMFTCRVMLQLHQTCACTTAARALAMCMGHGGQVAYLLANQPEEREQRVQEPAHAACSATPSYLLPKQAQLAIASGRPRLLTPCLRALQQLWPNALRSYWC